MLGCWQFAETMEEIERTSLGVREHFPVEWRSSEAEPLIRPIAKVETEPEPELELEPVLKRVDLIKGSGNQRVVIAKVIVTVWKRLSRTTRTTRTANNNKITIIALATLGAEELPQSLTPTPIPALALGRSVTLTVALLAVQASMMNLPWVQRQ